MLDIGNVFVNRMDYCITCWGSPSVRKSAVICECEVTITIGRLFPSTGGNYDAEIINH